MILEIIFRKISYCSRENFRDFGVDLVPGFGFILRKYCKKRGNGPKICACFFSLTSPKGRSWASVCVFINPLLWELLLSIADFNLFVDVECSFSYGRVLLYLPYFLHSLFILKFKTRKNKNQKKPQTNKLTPFVRAAS